MPFVDSFEQQHHLLEDTPYQIIVYNDHIVTRTSYISRVLKLTTSLFGTISYASRVLDHVLPNM